jgi:hypothetical protein
MTEQVHCNRSFVLSYVVGTATVGILYIIQNVTFYVENRSDAAVVTYNRRDGVHFKELYLYVTSITCKHGNLSL